ncbi:MAG: hypothetical protein LBG44_05755 [Gemmatimonadota bacterium]|jgi:hypothetical protein|nr:hypothetical protein [Gemmatimonadota bacterium]
MTTATFPKSYMTDAEREAMRQSGLSENSIFGAESEAADEAGDNDTAWKWLGLATLPAYYLLGLKHSSGADYVRSRGLNLAPAVEAYGADWLENPDI